MQTILILEDDKDLAEGIRLALKDDNLSFFLCETLQQARDARKSKAFDLYILDLTLPDGNGLELCREIRMTDKMNGSGRMEANM